MYVIIVNGKGGSGKDSAELFIEEYMKKKGEKVKKISIIDYTKQIAKTLGWDGTKTEKNRKFLCDLKKLLTDWNDLPFQVIETEIINANKEGIEFLFIDAREPDDIDRIKACSPNSYTLLIKRDEVDSVEYGNFADDGVFNYQYDYVIENNGSLIDLQCAAISFYEEIKSLGEFVG